MRKITAATLLASAFLTVSPIAAAGPGDVPLIERSKLFQRRIQLEQWAVCFSRYFRGRVTRDLVNVARVGSARGP